MPNPQEQQLNQALDRVMHHFMRTRLTYGRPFGLRSLEALALEILLKDELKGGSGLNPSQISTAMRVRGPVVSPVLASLQRCGHLEMHKDKTDRRCRVVQLTPQGREIAMEFARDKASRCRDMVEFFGKEDAAEFTRLLGRFSDFMEQADYFEEKGEDDRC